MISSIEKWKHISTYILISSLLALLIPVGQLYAATSYTYSDSSLSTKLKGSEHYIVGNHMVWVANDTKGVRQIYYQNLINGVTEEVTSHSAAKESPKVREPLTGETVVVWADKRNYNKSEYLWDIYAFNLTTQKEIKLNTQQGQHVSPSIQGNYVVWHNLSNQDMYVYDLTHHIEKYIGKGSYPVIADGKVAYKNATDGGLSMYEIDTEKTTSVLTLPYSHFVRNFAFNGKDLLVQQTNLHHTVAYRYINTQESTMTPVDLTPFNKSKKLYPQMAIGTNYAAWIEEKDGVTQIMGADLRGGQTFQMTNGNANQMLFGFLGDQLIMSGGNGELIYRTIIPTQRSNDVVYTVSDNKKIRIESWIGPDGGLVKLDSGEVIIEFQQDTFKEQSLVAIEADHEVIENSKEFLKDGHRFISLAWAISSSKSFNKMAKLVMTYDPKAITPQQIQKLGIYQYDHESSKWIYIGGKINTTKGIVETEISSTGIYAVMIYDKTFKDIKGHWAEQTIEIIASRWIVEGTSDQLFSPNMQLTRAQFTKMLGSAMGLEPIRPHNSSYSDVPTNHWGYEWIEAASLAGWVLGDRGQFRPDEVLTREQMMTIMIRALGLELQAQSLSDEEIARQLHFNDSAKVSDWAKSYVALTVKNGLIQGSNNQLLPIDSSTRAQAAIVVYRLLEYLNKL